MRGSRAERLTVLAVLLLLFAFSAVLTGCKPKQAVAPEAPDESTLVVDEEPAEPEPSGPVFPWNDNDIMAILHQDEKDWLSYADLLQEKTAIKEVLGRFAAAMIAEDVDDAVACVFEGQQESYRLLFEGKPEAMPEFGEILAKAEMCFLSESRDPEKTAFLRTAEYKVELDGFAFYVRFIKTAEGWVLYDF